MSKKYYDASVWASAMRSRRNAKAIIDANRWDYWVTLTFSDVPMDITAQVRRWYRDMEARGAQVFLVVACGDDTRTHAHALVRNMPYDMLVPGAVYERLLRVKTHGQLWTLTNADTYGIGLHAVQTIVTQDDINRIADYIVGHMLDMRDMIHAAYIAMGLPTSHLYHATRGLQRGKRYVWMIGGLKARLYDNRIQPAAVVLPACVAWAVSDWVEPDRIERYRSRGRRRTPMMRITGRLRDIHMALLLSDAVNLSIN